MDIVHQKEELKDWIDTITDENILEEILAIKSQKQFDFEKEWARSKTISEARAKSKCMIESLPWKK
ncbi:MAG: hypothetical protein WAT37_07450 [Saprospiraceae bacterium]